LIFSSSPEVAETFIISYARTIIKAGLRRILRVAMSRERREAPANLHGKYHDLANVFVKRRH